MNGKKLILIVIIISVLALIGTWIYGQKLINDLDLDRALDTGKILTTQSKVSIFTART